MKTLTLSPQRHVPVSFGTPSRTQRPRFGGESELEQLLGPGAKKKKVDEPTQKLRAAKKSSRFTNKVGFLIYLASFGTIGWFVDDINLASHLDFLNGFTGDADKTEWGIGGILSVLVGQYINGKLNNRVDRKIDEAVLAGRQAEAEGIRSDFVGAALRHKHGYQLDSDDEEDTGPGAASRMFASVRRMVPSEIPGKGMLGRLRRRRGEKPDGDALKAGTSSPADDTHVHEDDSTGESDTDVTGDKKGTGIAAPFAVSEVETTQPAELPEDLPVEDLDAELARLEEKARQKKNT